MRNCWRKIGKWFECAESWGTIQWKMESIDPSLNPPLKGGWEHHIPVWKGKNCTQAEKGKWRKIFTQAARSPWWQSGCCWGFSRGRWGFLFLPFYNLFRLCPAKIKCINIHKWSSTLKTSNAIQHQFFHGICCCWQQQQQQHYYDKKKFTNNATPIDGFLHISHEVIMYLDDNILTLLTT